MQKQLCVTRYKLLTYMDRLNLYEQILGGSTKAAELFDPEKYRLIRSKTILEVAFDFARVNIEYDCSIMTFFRKTSI